MRRTIVAFSLLLASAATASAQGLSPSVWQSQRGGLLKVLSVDPAGNFSGVFISSPTGPRPSSGLSDVEELDIRLQRDHQLVGTLCQSDYYRRKGKRLGRRPQGTGRRGFPAHLKAPHSRL